MSFIEYKFVREGRTVWKYSMGYFNIFTISITTPSSQKSI